MKVLGIETSCDETAASVVEDGRRALSDVVATQIELHRKWGGVVPELASRNHVMQVMPVCRIERKAIGDDRPGPVTKKLGEVLQRETRGPGADAGA